MEPTTLATPVRTLVDAGCLPADPLPWLLASEEPYAVRLTLTRLLGLAADDPAVEAARQATLDSPAVGVLLGDLTKERGRVPAGHHSPLFLPNRLSLIADLGVRRGDDTRLDNVLHALLEQVEATSRARRPWGAPSSPQSGSPSCDSNAIIEVLLRFGFATEPVVARAAARLARTTALTPQGRGWCCLPERPRLFAPHRMLDACPQITLEGLRALALARDSAESEATARGAAAHGTTARGTTPSSGVERRLLAAAETPLELWRRRSDERPYEFGHGYQFKTVKWPSFWYDSLAVVDAVGRFPGLWSGPSATAENRRSLAELAACLIAYNVDPDGRVTPRRIYRGYEQFSFGRKDAASPFATAVVLAALSRVAGLAEDIAAVDVETLPSSRGAHTRAVPPSAAAGGAENAVCPAPSTRSYDSARILPRVLLRHHLDTHWSTESIESVTADLVGLPAADPTAPYLALAARLPRFESAALESALDRHRSLVRIRCMRGQLYAVRRDLVPIVHAASTRQVVRYARDFAKRRHLEPAVYERLARDVLHECSEAPLTLRQLRHRISTKADLGAVVTLMCAERRLLQTRSSDDRFDRRWAYTPFADALSDVDLDAHSEDEARSLLLRAFVRGFGPVTHRDAAWWTGMDLKRVQRSLEALEDELVEVTFDRGEELWLMHAADVDELERATFNECPNVAVLPANDPLIVGYVDRSRFVEDAVRRFVFDAVGNAAPVVLVDGRIAAVWDLLPAGDDTAPRFLVFPVAPIDAEVLDRLRDKAAKTSLARASSVAELRLVAGMRPLDSRPFGAYAHPMR